jgi:hypothetical protein
MSGFFIPLELAELLHAALGPLSEKLEEEDHPWSTMVTRVLSEYTEARNRIMREAHGDSVIAEIAHQTYLAAERVCSMTEMALGEERDFAKWTAEFGRADIDGEA